MTLSKFLICHMCIAVSCISIHSQPYTMSRVNKDNIHKKVVSFEKEFLFNQKLRKITAAGLTVGGTAAAVGLAYLMFFAKTDFVDSDAPSIDTSEGLKATVAKHETIIKRLLEIKNQKFGSIKWAKSWAWYIVGSSFVIGTLIDKAFYYGSALLNKVFYNRTLSWFLASRTQIGSLILKKIDEREQYEMSWAEGVKELEQSATKLQESSLDDAQYYKQRITTNMNRIITDIESILAFIHYELSTIKCPQNAKQDIYDRIHHIKVISNKVAENLENMLNASSGPADTTRCLAPIKRYYVELEQELIGIVRDEQELLRQGYPIW